MSFDGVVFNILSVCSSKCLMVLIFVPSSLSRDLGHDLSRICDTNWLTTSERHFGRPPNFGDPRIRILPKNVKMFKRRVIEVVKDLYFKPLLMETWKFSPSSTDWGKFMPVSSDKGNCFFPGGCFDKRVSDWLNQKRSRIRSNTFSL